MNKPSNQTAELNQQLSLKRVFLVTLIASLSLSAFIAILIFLIGNFGEMETRLLLTTLTIGGYSLTGLCSSVLYDKRKYLIFSIGGFMVSILGFLITVGAIWEIIDSNSILKPVIIFIILAFSFAHGSLLLLARSNRTLVNFLTTMTLIFISVVALMLIYIVLSSARDIGEFYFRLLGVFAVLDVLGTIITPILRKLNTKIYFAKFSPDISTQALPNLAEASFNKPNKLALKVL